MYSVLIQSLLEHCIEECKNNIPYNSVTEDFTDYEDILLFHAAFSNFFNDELKRKVKEFAFELESKLDKNAELWTPFCYCSSIIMLNHILDEETDLEDNYWFSRIIDMTFAHQSGIRRYSANLMFLYLKSSLDPDLKLFSQETLKDKLIISAEKNIRYKHFYNCNVFALLSFLQLPINEKREIYEYLYKLSLDSNNPNDRELLLKYSKLHPYIHNPFSTEFSEYLLLTLKNINKAGYTYSIKKDILQYDLWGNPENKYFYEFKDIRLKSFIEFTD